MREVLPLIRVPTLVVRRRDDTRVDRRHAEYVRDHVPGARFVELPGTESILFLDDTEPLDGLEEIVTGSRAALDGHHALVRDALAAYDGEEVRTMGDGFLATFDGPARAVRCALRVAERPGAAGIPIRAGIHTGECERVGSDVAGIAVHIAARVLAAAGAGQVLVSRTVTDLVAGSGLSFEPRGAHTLRGVPGEWELFQAA